MIVYFCTLKQQDAVVVTFLIECRSMILIAESGSTKTEWCIVGDNGEIIEHCFTDGINPFFQSRKEISHIVRLQLPSVFQKTKFDKIYFYGAGCSTDGKKGVVKASLESNLKSPCIVQSDLVGAARAMFQNSPGIACILGVGSNSCFYDGLNIVKNVLPLGYILGDEGSGAVLGKAFLADCLKEIAPQHLIEMFYDKYGIDADEILDYVYTKPFPNKLLSLFSYFLAEHIEEPYVYDLVYTSIRAFFERNVLQYDYENYPVRFVGTIANVYSDILWKIAEELNVNIDMIIENPVERLIDYHVNIY